MFFDVIGLNLFYCMELDINLTEFECILKSSRYGSKDMFTFGRVSNKENDFQQMTKFFKIDPNSVKLSCEIKIKVEEPFSDSLIDT